jgi:hypothetical protein
VASGDILISGVVFPEVSPYIVVDPEQENSSATMPYTVRARGQVEARVWYEGYTSLRPIMVILGRSRIRSLGISKNSAMTLVKASLRLSIFSLLSKLYSTTRHTNIC